MKFISLFMLIVLVIVSGCSPQYGPAVWITAQPPLSVSGKNEQGAAIAADGNFGAGYHSDEKNNILRGHYYTYKSGSFYQYAAGGFTYFGSYAVGDRVPQFKGSHGVFGVGPHLDANAFLPLGPLHIGLGIYAGAALEFGGYPGFRAQAQEDGLISNFGGVHLTYLWSMYPMVEIAVGDRYKLSTRISIGIPGGVAPQLALRSNRLLLWASYYGDPDEEGGVSIGVSYQFRRD